MQLICLNKRDADGWCGAPCPLRVEPKTPDPYPSAPRREAGCQRSGGFPLGMSTRESTVVPGVGGGPAREPFRPFRPVVGRFGGVAESCRPESSFQGRYPNPRRVYSSTASRRYCRRSVPRPVLIDEVIEEINKSSQSVSFDALPSEDSCQRTGILARKARAVCRFLEKELQLRCSPHPPGLEVPCGSLREYVRSRFPSDVSVVAELSFKTVQKLEPGYCQYCTEKLNDRLQGWRESCFEPVEWSEDHVERFKATLRRNVPEGWNTRPFPYIPNGHASLGSPRRSGGNWVAGQFADWCEPEMVISSGKPRVVTLFSEFNTRVLSPLHYSLYSVLRQRGWLLVGSPTDEMVGSLQGFDYVSFDYRCATDRIKTRYVVAAVDVLIEKAKGLSNDEVSCLRVLSQLRLEPGGPVATRGQPMGSVMSFPLLCLINKTVFDLSLEDLLVQGKIAFHEWTRHRCRINGDDLLSREPLEGSYLRDRVSFHGSSVGLETNEEKTMVSSDVGEINSTAFYSGVRQRKVNAAALYMRPDVSDVLGFAAQSTITKAGFRRVVRANAHILAKQPEKVLAPLAPSLVEVCLGDAKIRKALSSVPDRRRAERGNLFPVEPRPPGYDLDRSEEVRLINDRVALLRDIASTWNRRRDPPFRTTVTPWVRSPRSALRYKKPPLEEDTILSVLAKGWETKVKESLRDETAAYEVFDTTPVEDCSRLQAICNRIKEWKVREAPRLRASERDCVINCGYENCLLKGVWSCDPFGDHDVVPLG